MIYLLFIIGFVLLLKGADWLVSGASELASRFGISEFVIGLTIVSIGTSMPELLVSILASVEGKSGLVIGNILGSNIANVLLILGVSAVVCDLPVKRETVLSEIPFSLTAALLVGFLANSTLWYERDLELYISRGDGVIILFFFLLFLIYVFMLAKEDVKAEFKEEVKTTRAWSIARNVFHIGLGVIGLFLGGKWVVDGAVEIAKTFKMSETFIGLTVIAIGTSLPELVTSVMAALKKNTDIAMGNIVGSNIFNLLWVLGISAVVKPLPFTVTSNVDLLMVIASSSMIILALILGRRFIIKRTEGIIFLMTYGAYVYFLVLRG